MKIQFYSFTFDIKRHYFISNITFNDAMGEEHREGEGVRLGKGILPPNLDKKEGLQWRLISDDGR